MCDNKKVDNDMNLYEINQNMVKSLPVLDITEKELNLINQLHNIHGNQYYMLLCNDMKYYSGVVFKGYLEGIPTGILSGGQYDRLLQNMGRKARAIGFAVYLSMLEGRNTQET